MSTAFSLSEPKKQFNVKTRMKSKNFQSFSAIASSSSDFFPRYSTIGFTFVFKAAFYVKASFDPFKCLILKNIRPVDVAHQEMDILPLVKWLVQLFVQILLVMN